MKCEKCNCSNLCLDDVLGYETGVCLKCNHFHLIGRIIKDPETFDIYKAMGYIRKGIEVRNMQSGWHYKIIDGSLKMRDHDLDGKWGSMEIIQTRTFSDFDCKWTIAHTIKEQPKTFGWDEAYRLMKEGKKITADNIPDAGSLGVNKAMYIFYQQNGSPYIGGCESRIRIVYENSGICRLDILSEHLDKKDWYVYEE